MKKLPLWFYITLLAPVVTFADLSVPNADLTSKVRVGPAEHKPVPMGKEAELLGSDWAIVNNSIGAGFLGKNFGPAGAPGAQLLYVDSRNGGTGFFVYLGKTGESGPVTAEVQVAARGDLPAAGYSIGLFTAPGPREFGALRPLVRETASVQPNAGQWQVEQVSAPSVAAGTHVYLGIKAEDSGAVPQQTLLSGFSVSRSDAGPRASNRSLAPGGAVAGVSGLSVQNPNFDALKTIPAGRSAALPTNAQVAEYLGNRWRVLANPGAAGLISGSFAPTTGAPGSQFLYVDGRAGGTVWATYLGQTERSGPVSVSAQVAARKDLPAVFYRIELARGSDASFNNLETLRSAREPAAPNSQSWTPAVLVEPEVPQGTHLYLILRAEDSGGVPQQTLFGGLQVHAKKLEGAPAPAAVVSAAPSAPSTPAPRPQPAIQRTAPPPSQTGLSVQNPTFDALKPVASGRSAALPTNAQAREFLGDRWQVLANPGAAGVISGSFAPDAGAQGNQFLYLDGRGGGTVWATYLGYLPKTGPVSVEVGVAARKDLPSVPYTLELARGSDASFNGLQEIATAYEPVIPSSGAWSEALLVEPEVPGGSFLYLILRAEDSGAVPQQTLFDNLRVKEELIEQVALEDLPAPPGLPTNEELKAAQRPLPFPVEEPGFGVRNPFLEHFTTVTGPIPDLDTSIDRLGPAWRVSGHAGLADPGSVPKPPQGGNAIYLGGQNHSGLATAYLGRLDAPSDVRFSVDMARRRGVPDAPFYILLFMADNNRFENLQFLGGTMNPVSVPGDVWTPYTLEVKGVPEGKHIYARMVTGPRFRRHEEMAFAGFQAEATEVEAADSRWEYPYLVTGRELPDIYDYRAESLTELRENFAAPPQETGPWVYWFWFDTALQKDDLTRQLREMVAAGISGAEIRNLRGVTPDMPNQMALSGHFPLGFLSDEFVECFRHVCAEAQRLNFKLSFNMGMGWPPGGIWVTPEHQVRQIIPNSLRARSHQIIEQTLAPETLAMAWKLEGGRKIVDGSYIDLSEFIDGYGTLRWRVPPGEWLVGLYEVRTTGYVDKGEGFPADPGSIEALQAHMDNVFRRLDPAIGEYYGETVVDVATDSWEYGRENNWSPGILEKFPEVAGYDFREKMYAMLGYGDDKDAVLEDLREVTLTVTRENYFEFITAYLNDKGLRHRAQLRGHGLERNLFRASSEVDIAEMEEEVYVPEAVWAARVLDKPIVGSESMTFAAQQEDYVPGTAWTPKITYAGVRTRDGWDFSSGTYRASPELLRKHMARHYAKGVNRVQLHSFSYTPAEADPMKWRMYAPIHLNSSLPWWPWMPALTDWAKRSQYLLQSGEPKADLFFYPAEAQHLHSPFEDFDPIRPNSAANGVTAADRTLFLQSNPGGNAFGFRNLILNEPLESAAEATQLSDWMQQGVTVHNLAGDPEAWPQSAGSLLAGWTDSEFWINQDDGNWNRLLEELRPVQWPDDAAFDYGARRFPDGVAYFLRNDGPDFSGNLTFSEDGPAELWDLDTGRIYQLPTEATLDGKLAVRLDVSAADAALVVFPEESQVEALKPELPRENLLLSGELKKDWVLTATPQPGSFGIDAPVRVQIDELVPWREIPALHDFAGVVRYSTSFRVPLDSTEDIRAVFRMGKPYELASVRVNGSEAGIIWRYPYELDISGLLQPGTNTLEIDVPNVLLNYEAREASDYPRPSGLTGPVVIDLYGGK